MSDVIQGDLADERPVEQRVLPMPTTTLLEHQVAKLLASSTPVEKLPPLIVTWMAPMIADRDHAIKRLRWLHAEQAWRLDEARAQRREELAEIALLREQVASVGRGMSRLLDELAEARTVAGLDELKRPDGVS